MNEIVKSDVREININRVDIVSNPLKVCHVISKDTKERLSRHVKSSTVLTASIMVDLALNLLLDELEAGNARLVVNLENNKE